MQFAVTLAVYRSRVVAGVNFAIDDIALVIVVVVGCFHFGSLWLVSVFIMPGLGVNASTFYSFSGFIKIIL